MSPLFSILIANYNNALYIKEAIDSVFAQTYTNWELIIVDDCSTDESKNVLLKYAHNKKIRIFYNDSNQGCGYTKRRCVEEARGELCGFLDPDDALAEMAVEIMVREHINCPEHSLVYSNHFECDPDLEVVKESERICNIPPHSDYLLTIIEKGSAIHHFAAFKRALYLQTAGILAEYRRAVDQDLYYKLEEVGSLKYIPESLYYYRLHQNGISNGDNVRSAWIIHLNIMEKVFRRRFNSSYIKNKKLDFYSYFISFIKFKFFIKSKASLVGSFLIRILRKYRLLSPRVS